MSALDELQKAVAAVAGKAAPAVVGIGGHHHRGSGVVVAKDRVLTNAHNVHEDGATCVFSDGRREQGKLLGDDMDGDLAVLEVNTGDVSPLAWSTAGLPGVGAVVFAVAGAANGGVRTTVGQVSGVARSFRGPGGRLISGSIEHTAPLASGSSGSPIWTPPAGCSVSTRSGWAKVSTSQFPRTRNSRPGSKPCPRDSPRFGPGLELLWPRAT